MKQLLHHAKIQGNAVHEIWYGGQGNTVDSNGVGQCVKTSFRFVKGLLLGTAPMDLLGDLAAQGFTRV